jgi:hypothetical protein
MTGPLIHRQGFHTGMYIHIYMCVCIYILYIMYIAAASVPQQSCFMKSEGIQ